MVSTLEQMQVPNGTGPGVRRSKRPLLASRTRCNVLWKLPKFGNKVKIGIKVQFGNKFANRCNVWSIEGVIVYGHVPECHVTFGRGGLHNVWWDPRFAQCRFRHFSGPSSFGPWGRNLYKEKVVTGQSECLIVPKITYNATKTGSMHTLIHHLPQ